MTLGRTSTGSIKIKTDGGLRAVECACCGGGGEVNACQDCPPFLADFNFSLTGDQVSGLTEFQYPASVCPSATCEFYGFPTNLPPRTCSDSWDAFSGTEASNQKLFIINLNRISTNGQLSGCAWSLSLSVSGVFDFEFMGEPDKCGVAGSASTIITSLDPRGSYPMTISAQCVPMGGPTEFNFTVTVS